MAKLAGEHYMASFYQCYGLETVALRYFNIFGPRQDPNGQYAAVIPKWIDMLKRGEQPTINGDGSNTRDVPHLPVINAFAERAKQGGTKVVMANADVEMGRKRTAVQQLIAAYRNVGQRWADLDPLQRTERPNIPELEPSFYGFTDADQETVFDTSNTFFGKDRMPLREGEQPAQRSVRFRTLGCYPLTGAVESKADTLPAIIQEMLLTTTSERQGRVIDHDQAASMEKKKQEGYF